MIEKGLTEEERALALQQYAAMHAPPRPSQQWQMENDQLNQMMEKLNQMKEAGVSELTLKPYLLKMMEKKQELMNRERYLDQSDEQAKPVKPEFI